MVNIENITRKEEEKKLKLKRTKDLLNKFFNDVHITGLDSDLISVRENKQSNTFLQIFPYSESTIIKLFSLEYYKQSLAFAREYEEKFKVNVTLQTDYSK